MATKDYYLILGVSRRENLRSVQEAFRELVHGKKNVFATLPVKTVSVLVPAELPRFENSRNVKMN
jgi:hypothetical protein